MKTDKEFPNGFQDWAETHHIVVQEISNREDGGGMVDLIRETQGTCGLWVLGQELTDEFEKLTEGEVWGGDKDYFDELYTFLNSKNL